MKILQVVPTYVPAYRYGGTIVSVHNLCRALSAIGHSVTVCTTNVDGPEDLPVDTHGTVAVEGVDVRYFPVDATPRKVARRLYRSRAMAAYLRDAVSQFDVVHLHSIYLWPTWYAARQARRCQIPYVLSPRGMLVTELIQQRNRWVKSAWFQAIEKKTIRRAAALHFTSPQEQHDAQRFALGDAVQWVIPNGVSLDEPGKPDIARQANQVLYLGRVSWKKGLSRLLEAMVNCPTARLTIAGNDDEQYTPQLQQLAHQLCIADRVEFVGFVAGAQKQQLLQQAAVLALCSDNENFGNVVLEAMAAACPVVVTEHVGAADIVAAHDAGLVVAAQPAEIAGAINQLLADPQLAAAKGQRGQQAALGSYHWPRVAEQMVDGYQSLLSPAN